MIVLDCPQEARFYVYINPLLTLETISQDFVDTRVGWGFMLISMENGWISLHRKIRDNPIWKNSQLVHLFLELLLLANHEETKFLWNGKEETLKRGQLITGRLVLSQNTGIPKSSIRNYLQLLQKLGILDIKPNNKFSLINIVKYSQYQDKKQKVDSTLDNKRTTRGQQEDTYNKVNNDNNETISVGAAKPQDQVNEVFKIFYKINPNINYGNKTERTAADWLIKRYGLEKTISAAEYAISVQGDKFAPTIMTPYQLKDKMAALAKHKGSKETMKGTLIL